MNKKWKKLREQYPNFYYKKVGIEQNNEILKCTYTFLIPNLAEFHPTIEIRVNNIKNKEMEWIKYYAFHIGMIEVISYVKCTCSPNIIVEAGYLNQQQINWFQKLYYNGLGEFRYRNEIEVQQQDFFHIQCTCEQTKIPNPKFKGTGNIIPIGGGKDSSVSLEILKDEKSKNHCFILNPKKINLNCAKIAGYTDEKIITAYRRIDPKLIKLNEKGYLNGHTPFSSLLAFLTYLLAYLYDKQYIILSNESSANQESVYGTNINHQYSKTYQFEQDFNHYIKQYFKTNIQYFSILRPLNELQIGLLFSQYSKYHQVFKSCNIGSKQELWTWCCNCPKCLFVFCILSPFLYKDRLIEIFKQDLFEKRELLETWKQLLGDYKNKPFECVGTYEEVRYAISLTISKMSTPLPYLLQYYKENYPIENNKKLEREYNIKNNLPSHFENLIRRELKKYVS